MSSACRPGTSRRVSTSRVCSGNFGRDNSVEVVSSSVVEFGVHPVEFAHRAVTVIGIKHQHPLEAFQSRI